LVPWDQANVHVSTHALHYGQASSRGFAPTRWTAKRTFSALDAHIRRLFNSCKVYRMPIGYTEDEIKQAIVDTIKKNGLKSATSAR
jgi:branched-chain amino acid aminotransferase